MRPAQKITIPADRMERMHYARRVFPEAKGQDLSAEWAGGRSMALVKLSQANPFSYGRNRNFLNGANTHLSPYIRHGCLSLNETFATIKNKFGLAAENLLMQLAWRDYWRQVWETRGNAIYSEMEPAKVTLGYAPLTEAVTQGKTGLPCMDAFITDLRQTGYVHNHARMWLASYIVHHLKMDWRQAADWFEQHLLDGDKASNHLSWQWVASTFSSKPYYFNQENLARFSGEKYCAGCSAACPFKGSYEDLQARLFSQPVNAQPKQYPLNPVVPKARTMHKAVAVFIHDEMLSPTNSVLQQPFPKLFVFDPALHGAWPLHRLQFVMDCLSEMMNVEVWVGDTYAVLEQKQVGELLTQATPNTCIKDVLAPFLVKWLPVEKLANIALSDKRLQRFSRYWDKAGPLLLGG